MIRRSWLSTLCALVVLLTSTIAQAKDEQILKYALECDEDNWALCAQPLLQGEPAPFDGQLLSPELAIKLGQRALDFDIELTIQLDRQQKLHDIEMGYLKDVYELEKVAAEKKIDVLEEALEEAGEIPWYQTPGFVAVVSCVATGLLIFGASYLVQVAH